MNTLEVYVYCCKGIAGAPADQMGMHVTGDKDDQPRPLDSWSDQTYWLLAADESNGYPPVLMHVYFEGQLPSDRDRDEINYHVKRLTGKLLFNQD